ncbi:ATP-binding domain-containing protein 4 [Aphelenchoides besseyi]|nr:ATP-binding domain-containing protein 4 [Aphelenchoides besseyi]
MTCGLAVKRPHDYEAYLDADIGIEVKRHRPTHCSPFRPQFGTLAASLPSSGQSPKSSNGFSNARNAAEDSPFAVATGRCQLSSNQLEDYLRAEVRYLKRRRLIPRHTTDAEKSEVQSTAYRRGGSSPASHSGSDSEGENHSAANSNRKMISDLYERPHFSMNQVKLICERLLKEQETRLRYEYETVLNRKLDEQYEQYVQFAKEQLENRPSSTDFSYSCYNLMLAKRHGHEIVCLANLHPPSDKEELDSYMYQSVGSEGIKALAAALQLPLYRKEISGTPKNISSEYKYELGDEVEDLFFLLSVSVGAILSSYQKDRVDNVCKRLGLTPLCYLWERDQLELYDDMIQDGIDAIIIKVAAAGLTSKHLGMTLKEARESLIEANKKYQLNICGEGGEYETYVIDSPLHEFRVSVDLCEAVLHSDNSIAPVAYLRLSKVTLVSKREESCSSSSSECKHPNQSKKEESRAEKSEKETN